MAEEQIIIRIRAIDEATNEINKIANSIGKLKIDMPKINLGTTAQSFNKVRVNVSNLNKQATDATNSLLTLRDMSNFTGLSIRKLNQEFRNMNVRFVQGIGFIDTFTGKQVQFNQSLKQATIQARRFKFEWLSLLFAGMALDRVLGGLVQSQFQLYGVTDLLSSAWTIVLEPIMNLLVPLIYDLLDAFMNLPEGMKLAVGGAVLFLAVVGKLLALGGQVALFFGGLKSLLPGVFSGGIAGAKGFIATIAGVGSTILIVAGIVTAVVVGMYLAWKENFLNMKETVANFIEGVKQFFGGFVDIIKGIVKIVTAIFTGDFDLLIAGLKQTFTGLWNFLVGGFKAVANLIKGILTGVLKIIVNIVNLMLKFGGAIGNLITGKGFNPSGAPQIPSFQTGGIMPHTGLAYLHAGERIIPRNESSQVVNFSPNITINAEVTSGYDVRRLASELNEYWASDFRRLAQSKI